MEYTEEQLKFIQKKRVELINKTETSIDTFLVEFLKQYELFVKPFKKTKFNINKSKL